MSQRKARINRIMQRAERLMSKASMRADVQRFYATGEKPTSEPAASFVNLMATFDRMTDASVGGDDYGQAAADYERAAKAWDQAERGIEWA